MAYAEPNFIRTSFATPNDPRFTSLWALQQASDLDIDAPEAWDRDNREPQPDRRRRRLGRRSQPPWTSRRTCGRTRARRRTGSTTTRNGFTDDVRGWDFVNNDNLPMDDNGHGSHVAGIIGARGNNAARDHRRQLAGQADGAEGAERERRRDDRAVEHGLRLCLREGRAHRQPELRRLRPLGDGAERDRGLPEHPLRRGRGERRAGRDRRQRRPRRRRRLSVRDHRWPTSSASRRSRSRTPSARSRTSAPRRSTSPRPGRRS